MRNIQRDAAATCCFNVYNKKGEEEERKTSILMSEVLGNCSSRRLKVNKIEVKIAKVAARVDGKEFGLK